MTALRPSKTVPIVFVLWETGPAPPVSRHDPRFSTSSIPSRRRVSFVMLQAPSRAHQADAVPRRRGIARFRRTASIVTDTLSGVLALLRNHEVVMAWRLTK